MAAPRTTYFALRDEGIYDSWPDLEARLPGLENPVFKAFRTLSAAEAFMAGWDDNSSSSPFGYAGPSTLPPTPVNKLGRVGRGGEREESREERKKRKKNFAAPSSAARQVQAAGSGNGDLLPSAFGPSPFAASTSALAGSPSAGPSSSPSSSSSSFATRPALRNTQSMPLMSELHSPPSLLSPPMGSPGLGAGRRRSPLIQSVVEEEEDEVTAPSATESDLLSPPPSSESEGNSFEAARSRASSVSGASVDKAGRRKGAFGLGLGGVFSSTKPLLSPPSSPDRRRGSSSSGATTDDPAGGGSGKGVGTDDATLRFGRFSIRRKASAPSMSRDDASSIRSSALSITSASDAAPSLAPRRRSMWDDSASVATASTPKAAPVSPPTSAPPLRGTVRQASFASRSLEPPVRPAAASRHQSSSSIDSLRSNKGAEAGANGSSSGAKLSDGDPHSPFASQAPVFSRRESAGSGVILPLKASAGAGSSSSSLRRLSSANSLSRGVDGARARDNPHRFSFGSATSLSSSLSVLEPPPKILSSRFSYSSSRSGSPLSTPLHSPLGTPLASPSASVDSFSDALTHISASTPRTSPDGADHDGRRESMFEQVDLPPTPDDRSAANGRRPAPPTKTPASSADRPTDSGWKKAVRRMKSAFGGGDATPQKSKGGLRA